MSERYLWMAIVVLCLSAMGLAQVYGQTTETEGLDDPTRPPGYARPGQKGKQRVITSWRLSAIRIDAQRRMAIINGKTVEQGDWVGQAYVVEILPDRVRLKTATEKFEVKLIERQMKKSLPVQETK